MWLVVQSKFLRRHSCGWLLTLAWRPQDTCLRGYDSQVSWCQWHLWNCHKIWSSLCALCVATPFPGARGHLGWCDRASHSASAGWVDSISEDALLLRYSVQFSRSVVSDSLWPHESQHARPPCPSPTPGVHSDSHPASQWCHPAISSSVVPFSSYPQSLLASGSFPMNQLFAWGAQRIGVTSSASAHL